MGTRGATWLGSVNEQESTTAMSGQGRVVIRLPRLTNRLDKNALEC